MRALKNHAIVVVLAALVAFAPGAGLGASVVASVVNAAIIAVIVFVVGMLYRRHQQELWSLGDSHRALLYAALGGFVLLMAGRHELTATPAGTAVLLAGLAAVVAAIWAVVVRFRRYG